MRWIGFIVIAGIVVTMQASLGPWLSVGGVRPDLCLVFVVFLSLRVRAGDAGIGAFFMGVAGDLMSIERFGLLAVSYMLVAMLVSFAKEFLFRRHVVAFVAVTLVAGLVLRMSWLIYRHLLYDSSERIAAALLDDVFGGAVYSAFFALISSGGLVSISAVFCEDKSGYAHSTRNRLA